MSPLPRSAYSILVPSAGSTAGIAVIRSLGTAGYCVHAAASNKEALGLRSRFVTKRAFHPPTSTAEFIDWLRDYVRGHQIAMIMPGWSLGLLSHPAMSEFADLFPVSRIDAVLKAAGSKAELFSRLSHGNESHRANLPPFVLLDFDRDVLSEKTLAALPLPLFIKLDGSLARSNEGDAVIRVGTIREALCKLEGLAGCYRNALVQGYVPGRGVGAFVLRWDDRSIARMMHQRLHEMPHTGGASSLRRTWWHEPIMRDAELKLEHLGWVGVAMVEYRWDAATDKFYLMEMNLRFWGSLHLALYAGVDFPRLLADAFIFEIVPEPAINVARDVICRNTFPFELGYLISLWRDPSVAMVRKMYAGIEALGLSLNPRVYNDLLYPGDRRLYFERIKDMITGAYSRG